MDYKTLEEANELSRRIEETQREIELINEGHEAVEAAPKSRGYRIEERYKGEKYTIRIARDEVIEIIKNRKRAATEKLKRLEAEFLNLKPNN